jgi:DNA-binding MurR/RpiR family transcriptional regulator
MGVIDRIAEHADRLTPAERKVAEILANEPQTVAFGTVANVAEKAGTSGPSVVRLAVKLGYAGFVDLQADVQQELARQLGPARDRIRQRPPSDVLGRTLTAELDNVSQSLSAIDEATFRETVAKLSDRRRHIFVLPGEMTFPAGQILAGHLSQLRDGVTLLHGSEVAASRHLGTLDPGDILIAIDMRRYERWVLTVLRWCVDRGATVIAITDSPLSPLATHAEETLLIGAQGVGPFDSLVGAVSLMNAIVAGVAAKLRQSATSRLDAIEAAWAGTEALVAGGGAGSGAAGGGGAGGGGGGGASGVGRVGQSDGAARSANGGGAGGEAEAEAETGGDGGAGAG